MNKKNNSWRSAIGNPESKKSQPSTKNDQPTKNRRTWLPKKTLCYTNTMTTETNNDIPHHPNIAIILTTKRSKHLREVTKKRSKTLVRIKGITLVEQTVQTLLTSD